MRPTDPKVTLSGTWLKESEKAVQFSVKSISGCPIEKPFVTWFPFSQAEKWVKAKEGEEEDSWIIVSEWIVKQKPGLAEYLDHSDPAPVGFYVPPQVTKRTQKPYTELDPEKDIPF